MKPYQEPVSVEKIELKIDPGVYSDSVIIIDLRAVRENYRTLKNILGDKSECAGTVKANAYGLGAVKVAEALAKEGCKKFFVATFEEAIKIRSVLKDETIYVLHGVYPHQEELFLEYKLTPVLNHLFQIEVWNKFALSNNLILPAIIHIDTAMSRLGVNEEDIEFLVNNKERLAGIELLYIMSHLASADELTSPLNKMQLEKLKQLASYFPNIPLSLCNSSGIFLGEEYHLDLCRPGCALYGLNPTPYSVNPMKPVVKLLAKILQIRHLKKDTTVGYSATFTAKAGSKLATISFGYADGYLRSLGNNSYCYIAGYKAPIIGRVSMDLITIDVTDIPEDKIYLGAEVELLGENVTPDNIATQAGTLGYEILTNLGDRYKRIYLE
jgi:alanine racemase